MNIKAVRLHNIFLVLVILVVSIFLSVWAYARVYAADYPKLQNRSLRIDDATPGEITSYTVSWRYPSVTTIGSIRMLLCTDPIIDDPCINPGGDFSAANLVSQSGITGFSISSQSANEILLSRAPAGASTIQSTYEFDAITNPVGLQQKFFIRIQTYTTNDGSGAFNHASAVANATTEPIVITTEVPPILYFCAAITITEWCDSISGNMIDYGDLSPYVTDVGTSQFGVATNAEGGYVVVTSGKTMTAGNKQIDPIETPTANLPGIAQFGLNLRANTDPPLGQDPTGIGIGTVAAEYDSPDLFKYEDGDVVASAVTGSMFNTFTVTYIVNVAPDQPSGIYNTTVTYICTAAF